MEIFSDKNLLIAKGNVTLTTQTQRISADSLEFDLQTKLGTFHHASGNARIHGDDGQNAGSPGAPARPASNQFGATEPDVLFYGETIEKIGERKYRITNGGFTTCVQPEPRWQLTSGTVVLNIDHYAMLRNMVMNVKGVPLFYLPVIYYPINKEDRATGFLMPVYGSSTLRGQTHQQRLLLGDQPQPGCDGHARLVLEDAARAWAASTATSGPRRRWASSGRTT